MKYYVDEDENVSWTWKTHEDFFVKNPFKRENLFLNSVKQRNSRYDSQSAHTRIFFDSILTIDIKLYSISVMYFAIVTHFYFRSHRSMRRCFFALQRPYDTCRLCASCVMFTRILFAFKRSHRDILTSKTLLIVWCLPCLISKDWIIDFTRRTLGTFWLELTTTISSVAQNLCISLRGRRYFEILH